MADVMMAPVGTDDWSIVGFMEDFSFAADKAGEVMTKFSTSIVSLSLTLTEVNLQVMALLYGRDPAELAFRMDGGDVDEILAIEEMFGVTFE